MGKGKKEIIWLSYYIGLFVLTTSLMDYLNSLMKEWSQSYTFGPFYVYGILTMLLVSLYLSIPHLIRQHRLEGNWTVNYHKLLIIGIPFLIFSLLTLGGGYSFGLPSILSAIVFPFIRDGFIPGLLTAAIFGYVVFTSISKKVIPENKG
jgi:hypothetical protein